MKFKPTRSEIRRIRDMAAWCEKRIGSGYTIGDVPSSEFWSSCAFALAAEVAARG